MHTPFIVCGILLLFGIGPLGRMDCFSPGPSSSFWLAGLKVGEGLGVLSLVYVSLYFCAVLNSESCNKNE